MDSSLNESVSDGEESHGDASPSQVCVPAGSPGVSVQTSDDQVQGVIQASVIQTAQVAAAAALGEDAAAPDTQKRRHILSRRPSYRKILSELSSGPPTVPSIHEEQLEEEEAPASRSAPGSAPAPIYQAGSGQFIAVTQDGAVQLSGPGGGAPQQFYLPGGQVVIQAATGDIPAYQLRSPSSGLAQGIVMAASPGPMQSPSSVHAEEITRKREVRLMKNREAARECRRKKKEYVKCLENRVAVLENQNKTLIEELKALKDIYCHKAE